MTQINSEYVRVTLCIDERVRAHMFGIMYVRFSIDDHDQVWVVEFVSVFGLAQYKTYVSSVQSHKHTFIQMHTIAASSQCTFTCCRCIVKNVPLTNGPNKCTFSPWALIYVEYRTRLIAGNTIAMNFSINPRISSLECQMHMHVIMISVKSFGTFFSIRLSSSSILYLLIHHNHNLNW